MSLVTNVPVTTRRSVRALPQSWRPQTYRCLVSTETGGVVPLRAVPALVDHTPTHPDAVAALFDAASQVSTPDAITMTVGPSPQRLAPYAHTLLADLCDEDGEIIGSGRFVLLHDPAGHPGWKGTWRVVSYLRAEVDEHMATDPLLPEVAWSWMQESWSTYAVLAAEVSGTVTCNQSRPFGDIGDRTATADIEVRCSWTPSAFDNGLIDVVSNVKSWLLVLMTAAGLPQTGH